MVHLIVLLVLLSCSPRGGLAQNTFCQLATVCVASEDGTEAVGCDRPDSTPCCLLITVYQLSDIPQEAKNCTSVHIHLASSTHILREDLDFTDSVENTQIHGAQDGSPTVVTCSNNAGIRFSERNPNGVFISNLTLTHCGREHGTGRNLVIATLYFTQASYRLYNVTVTNSQGYGLVAYCCTRQMIEKCTFDNQMRHIHFTFNCDEYFSGYNIVQIKESTFTRAKRYYAIDVSGESDGNLRYYNTVNFTIQNSKFSHNKNGALRTRDIKHVEISGCLFTRNYGVVVSLVVTGNIMIRFEININKCNFTYNDVTKTTVVKISEIYTFLIIPLTQSSIEATLFEGNHGDGYDCSALSVSGGNVTLNDVSIVENDCTGIDSDYSNIRIENHLNLTRNHGKDGGGLRLTNQADFQFHLLTSSNINISSNRADKYGGGLFFEDCTYYEDCFFQFDGPPNWLTPRFKFSGNRAILGGDAVFGGCLSNCYIVINQTWITINKDDPNNIFWDLVSSENIQSQSTFVNSPERVVFCTNTSSVHPESIICNDSYTVSAYRGEVFNVPLMVADRFCSPSIKLVKAEVNRATSIRLEQGSTYLESKKYCSIFRYVISGGVELNKTTILFNFQETSPRGALPPVVLTIDLTDCPLGLMLNSEGRCECNAAFETHRIQCHSDTHTLVVPALTWVGVIRGNVVVQRECQYCRSEGELMMRDIARDSYKLCTAHRTQIMCGACRQGHSLQLGGYECADCSNSTHKGVLLVTAFLVVGVVLVLLLMRLNLTVSTGVINSLVFYSNIVYLSSNTLLPISREGNSPHLQNMVQVLYTFQAWMNLDFGIITCFFNGYDTYVSTWMQFVFPLYIWLLILIIVVTSRYSTRIAKLTTSNTVSVLATLLLLSYSKLLKTSIETFSSTKLYSLDGEFIATAWKQDANITYLGRIHVWLFLMSLLVIVFYIVPFTLLVVLGPKLLVTKWGNKMKPFLDTFYGPYTRRYRYWPGILLLLRLVVLCMFAFLSPNNSPFRLMTVSLLVIVLFFMWMTISKPRNLHRKISRDYLELFFLSNLGIFSAISIYLTQFTDDKVRNQQALSVAMVGSVLAVFCGILVYQALSMACMHRAMLKLVTLIPTGLRDLASRKEGEQSSPQEIRVNEHTITTHTTVKMLPNNELRERLLTDS